MCLHAASLYVLYVCVCLWVYMHGSSLYVYASVYRCICMRQVYMYKRVFIGVYAWIEFICISECL